MTVANAKTRITETLREMERIGRKTTNEFQIHKWKVSAKVASTPIDVKRLLGIISNYENNYSQSKKYFEQAIKESSELSYIVIDDYAKCLLMSGNLASATDQIVKLIDLNVDKTLIDNIVTISMTTLNDSPVRLLIQKLQGKTDTEALISSLENVAENILKRQSEYESIGLSMDAFRSLMDLIHQVFYKKFVGMLKYNFFGSLDYSIRENLMVQVEALTPEEISEVNDDLIDGLIKLSEKYDPVNLSKLTVYFSSNKTINENAA